MFFAGFLKIMAPGVGLEHNFSASGVDVSNFLCAPGVGNSPFKKISPGVGPEGMVRLGID